jgi:transcriptional regulator with XRE-family HTH domain
MESLVQKKRERKPKSTPKLPMLCSVVRQIRETAGWSQEQMAQQTGIASQTISRFERGVQEPRDLAVLLQLSKVADAVGFQSHELAHALVGVMHGAALSRLGSEPRSPILNYNSPHVWRLMQTARIAADYFPDEARAMEAAAPQALALVDEVLRSVEADEIERHAEFYQDLELRVSDLAARKLFWQQFMKGGKQ